MILKQTLDDGFQRLNLSNNSFQFSPNYLQTPLNLLCGNNVFDHLLNKNLKQAKANFPSYDSSIVELQGGTMYKYKAAHKGGKYRHNLNFNVEVPQMPESFEHDHPALRYKLPEFHVLRSRDFERQDDYAMGYKPAESIVDDNELNSNKLIGGIGFNEESFQMLKPVFNQNNAAKKIHQIPKYIYKEIPLGYGYVELENDAIQYSKNDYRTNILKGKNTIGLGIDHHKKSNIRTQSQPKRSVPLNFMSALGKRTKNYITKSYSEVQSNSRFSNERYEHPSK